MLRCVTRGCGGRVCGVIENTGPGWLDAKHVAGPRSEGSLFFTMKYTKWQCLIETEGDDI